MADRGKFAVFVDRDGTICFDRHYLADPDGLEIIPSVAEGIKKLNGAGIPVIVVTNQSGIGRGLFSKEALDRIHDRLQEMLASQGARFDDIFYCPHKPDDGCDCRKPKTGMLEQARKKHGFDLTKSFVVGDRMMDIEMAHAVGAVGVLVPEPGDQYKVDKEIAQSKERPDFRTALFSKAADWILAQVR